MWVKKSLKFYQVEFEKFSLLLYDVTGDNCRVKRKLFMWLKLYAILKTNDAWKRILMEENFTKLFWTFLVIVYIIIKHLKTLNKVGHQFELGWAHVGKLDRLQNWNTQIFIFSKKTFLTRLTFSISQGRDSIIAANSWIPLEQEIFAKNLVQTISISTFSFILFNYSNVRSKLQIF